MVPLQRSGRAKFAAQVFFREFNDVDIFIEDTAVESKKIYLRMLRRALGDQLSVDQIFPIGSKSSVLSRCAADQGERARPAVYIVDGDHDEVLGVELPALRRLFRLGRYCIENYLFDGAAVAQYIDDEVIDYDIDEITRQLNFHGWLSDAAPLLKRAVVSSLSAHLLNCGNGIPRANIGLGLICEGSHGPVSQEKVDGFSSRCKSVVDSRHGDGIYERTYYEIELRFQSGDDVGGVVKFVSGKAVLLPLLKRRIRTLFGLSGNDAVFRSRLAKYCNVDELKGIRECVA